MVYGRAMGKLPSEFPTVDEEKQTELEIEPLTNEDWSVLETFHKNHWDLILHCERDSVYKLEKLGWLTVESGIVTITPTGKLICALQGWSS